MKFKPKFFIAILFSLFAFTAKSQASDSLWQIWEDTSKEDTVRLQGLKNFIRQTYLFTKPDSAAYFSQLQYEFADKNNVIVFKGDALATIGITYYLKGELDSAIFYYEKSIEIFKDIGHKLGLAKTIMNLGSVYYIQGNYAKTIEYYTQSLRVQEELHDTLGQAQCLSNIGTINLAMDNLEDAEKCFETAIELYHYTNDKVNLSTCINNLGIVYFTRKQYEKAKAKYSEALSIRKEGNDQVGIAGSINNIGLVEFELGNYEVAEKNYKEAMAIFESVQDQHKLLTSRNGLAQIYAKTGRIKLAIETYEKCLKDGQNIGNVLEVKNVAFELYKLYKKAKPRASLEMYELYVEMRDSTESEENQQELIRQKFKYEYEKQAATDSISNVEKEKVMAAELQAEKIEKKAQKTQNIYLWVGIGVVSFFGLFLYNRFKVTQKQKTIIETQKEKVDDALKTLEEKNKEIMDSIVYAKRIQTAILPTNKEMNGLLPESFILYMPKDIVAGDFYWLEKPDRNSEDILFAVADCTGHGVPGAMVSVICNNGLSRSVREHKLSEPGQILDKTREIVIQEFEKSEDKVNDGMDIALLSLKGKSLQYAGANNPLWIIRNGEIIETKANKQPIGNFESALPYTTHHIELQSNDCIYIFTDGFVDQFGGKLNKKFKPVNLRRVLLKIHAEDMESQKDILKNEFSNWKGNQEQVDDVCLFGFRIK